MADLRSRLPAQSLMERTLELHSPSFYTPSGDALSWYKGALGEIAVAGVLAWLDSNWTVLHSVPIGRNGADIDHVVVGPAGAFTINTKSHPRADIWVAEYGLYVGGQSTNYVNKAGFEAKRTSELLEKAVGFSVPVTPLIVFVNPGRRTIKVEAAHRVRVLADWELLEYLTGQRREFSDEQIMKMSSAAVRPDTWNASPTSALPDRKVAIHFNAMVARSLQGARPDPSKTVQATPPASAVVAAGATNRKARTPRRPAVSRPSNRRPAGSRRSRQRTRAVNGLIRAALTIGALWLFVGAIMPAMLNEMAGR